MLDIMKDNERIVFTGVSSLVLGIITGFLTSDSSGEIRRFNYLSNGKTNQVLRLERNFARDQIYIGDAQGDNFTTLRKYLDLFENNYDRSIKESEIKKLIEW